MARQQCVGVPVDACAATGDTYVAQAGLRCQTLELGVGARAVGVNLERVACGNAVQSLGP